MITVDPIEVIARARRKCPGYVGTWTVEALKERRIIDEINESGREIRRLQKEIEVLKNETVQSGTSGPNGG